MKWMQEAQPPWTSTESKVMERARRAKAKARTAKASKEREKEILRKDLARMEKAKESMITLEVRGSKNIMQAAATTSWIRTPVHIVLSQAIGSVNAGSFSGSVRRADEISNDFQQQVFESRAPSTFPAVSSMAPSNVSSSSTTFKSPAPTIRRLDSIPRVDLSQDTRPFDLTIYDMSDNSSHEGSVRMIKHDKEPDLLVDRICACLDVCECAELPHPGYSAFSGSELIGKCPVFDMAVSDADGLWTFADSMSLSEFADCEQADVRMVASEAPFEIILDSGADISVLPIGWEGCGQPRDLANMRFRDAQGNPISMSACRDAIV